MESRALSRAMVESVVDRSLREIVSDPDRSLPAQIHQLAGALKRSPFLS